MSKMLAVTIGIGDDWQKLAEFAADRMRKMTGLRVVVAKESSETLVHPAWLKCSIMRQFPEVEAFMIFDADMICLRKWEPLQIYNAMRGAFCVVAEPLTAPVATETENYGVKPGCYFNSGLIICGHQHQPIFDDALTRYPVCGSWIEQTSLNISAFAKGEVTLIPEKFNTLAHRGNYYRVNQSTVNAHFCGVKSPETITEYATRLIEIFGEQA